MLSHISPILTPFLASPQRPEGTLTFYEVQGFLFTIACSPELVKPSEWLPLIFNEHEADYANDEEALSVMQALIDLNNIINNQVQTGEITLLDEITFTLPALENIGKTTIVGQWSYGFLLGHDWLHEIWDHYIPDELSEELGSTMMVLSFFSSQSLADAYYTEIEQSSDQTLEQFATVMQDTFANALMSYLHMGRSIQTALNEHGSEYENEFQHELPQPYIKEHKTGRNELCPCGSGKKYKKCCLH
ncbi:MAG: UPF0149 family protein [Thiohalomonadales bacterium]